MANIALDLNTHEVTGSLPDGSSLVLTRDADGIYAAQLTDGNVLEFEVTNDKLVLKTPSLAPTGEPTGEPTVTCVTGTPKPGVSASPTTSSSATASPILEPTVSARAAAADSPFFCGAEIAGDEHGTDNFGISQVSWVSPDDVNADASMYNLGDGAPWHADGDADVLRVVAAGSWFSSPDVLNLGGGAGNEDPIVFANTDSFPLVAEDSVAEGLTLRRGP